MPCQAGELGGANGLPGPRAPPPEPDDDADQRRGPLTPARELEGAPQVSVGLVVAPLLARQVAERLEDVADAADDAMPVTQLQAPQEVLPGVSILRRESAISPRPS